MTVCSRLENKRSTSTSSASATKIQSAKPPPLELLLSHSRLGLESIVKISVRIASLHTYIAARARRVALIIERKIIKASKSSKACWIPGRAFMYQNRSGGLPTGKTHSGSSRKMNESCGSCYLLIPRVNGITLERARHEPLITSLPFDQTAG